jgi:hypothetical protein
MGARRKPAQAVAREPRHQATLAKRRRRHFPAGRPVHKLPARADVPLGLGHDARHKAQSAAVRAWPNREPVMNRKFVVLLAALAAFVLAASAADAGQRKPIDPTIDATNFWVGAAWTGAAIAMSKPVAPIVVGTTVGCMATAPMVATVVLNRPLKYREAHILIGSCLIPVIGAWLVDEAYNEGWLWAPDEKPVRKARHKKKM